MKGFWKKKKETENLPVSFNFFFWISSVLLEHSGNLTLVIRLQQSKGPKQLSGAVEGRTDVFDVIVEQCVVSDRNLACAIRIGHETLPDNEVKVCLLP